WCDGVPPRPRSTSSAISHARAKSARRIAVVQASRGSIVGAGAAHAVASRLLRSTGPSVIERSRREEKHFQEQGVRNGEGGGFPPQGSGELGPRHPRRRE